MFKPANKNCESLSKFIVSRENVENVVKPPQKPMPNSSFRLLDSNSLSSYAKIKNPNNKLPRILTIRVPKGK